ncbi:MAG TPA: hypothetical protein VLD39_08335 [Gammaproteobacteria bacterium]|nr:hypothetical protein [Gammaproteobacteria bacterium]
MMSALGILQAADAQDEDEADHADGPEIIAELTAGSDRFDGLFTPFRNRGTETHRLIKPEQLGREYIYFAVSMDGVVQGGHFRSSFREPRLDGRYQSGKCR